MKKSDISIRKYLLKPRRIPIHRINTNAQPGSKDDDPPSVIPEGYINPHRLVKEGDEIEVWWEGDDKYYPGLVSGHRSDGKHRIEYTDGQVLYHFLNREVFVLTGKAREQFLARCFRAEAEAQGNDRVPICYPGLKEFLEVGQSVEVYWPHHREWYPGVISAKSTKGRFRVLYDDGDKQTLKMETEIFRWLGDSAAIVHARLMDKYSEQFS